jgi:hypothetical protein
MLVSRYGVIEVRPGKTTKLTVRMVEIGTLHSRKRVRSDITCSTLLIVHLVCIPWQVFRALGHLVCRLATNPPTMNCPREPDVYHVTIDIKLRVFLVVKTFRLFCLALYPDSRLMFFRFIVSLNPHSDCETS